jgi:hypothetical protein
VKLAGDCEREIVSEALFIGALVHQHLAANDMGGMEQKLWCHVMEGRYVISGNMIVMRGEPSGGKARLGEGSRARRNYKKLLMMSEHGSEKVSSEIAEIESGKKRDRDRDVVGSVLCLKSVNRVSQKDIPRV